MDKEEEKEVFEGGPEVEESRVQLILPAPLRSSDTLRAEDHSITLVQVKNPKKSSYSLGKKQCDLWEYVWGSSLLLSSLLSVLPLEAVKTL